MSIKKRDTKSERKKSRLLWTVFKPKNYLEILLSAHALALQANILQLN